MALSVGSNPAIPGIAKIEISIAKGKKLYDKRNTIKERENKINLKRKLKF